MDLKDFHRAFDHILNKIKSEENFAFTRFSDGELFILQNKHLLLSNDHYITCLLYTSPSPRDRQKSRMPSSA